MQTIDLNQVPNQSFTTTQDNDRYAIAIYLVGSSMAYDLARNEIQLVTGQRLLPGKFLAPYAYVQGEQHGNFLLLTNNGDLPDFNEFGKSQTFMYMSFDEVGAALLQ